MNITINDIKIKIKLLNPEGNILAQATVILFDIWEEKAWKVLKSNKIHPVFQEQVWIQAPSYKAFGKWKEIIFVNDKHLYDQVQEKIYDSYRLVVNKKEGEESITNKKDEIVNPDDIPNLT